MAELAGAIATAPVCAGTGLSPVTATLTYGMPDTFVMKTDGNIVSLAAIRRRKPIPSSDGKCCPTERPGPASRLLLMATRDRVIHVSPDAYDRLEREAGRRGVQPDALADELLAAELAPASSDLESILAELAEIRGRMRGGGDDAVAIVREGREELERRGL